MEKLTFVYFNQVKRAANKHELRTLRDNLNYAMRAQDAVVDATSSDEVVPGTDVADEDDEDDDAEFSDLDEYIKRPYELPATRTTAIETEVDVLVGRLESENTEVENTDLLTRGIQKTTKKTKKKTKKKTTNLEQVLARVQRTLDDSND